MIPDRIASGFGQIIRLSFRSLIHLAKPFHDFFLLLKLPFRTLPLRVQPFSHALGRALVTYRHIEQATQKRRYQNQDDPRDLVGRIILRINDPQHCQDTYNPENKGQARGIMNQLCKSQQKPAQLNSQKNTEYHNPVQQLSQNLLHALCPLSFVPIYGIIFSDTFQPAGT